MCCKIVKNERQLFVIFKKIYDDILEKIDVFLGEGHMFWI